MTRKDFELIAAALAASKPAHPITPDGDESTHEGRLEAYGRWYAQWARSVIAVADALERTHPRFDVERFFVAAGGRVAAAWAEGWKDSLR